MLLINFELIFIYGVSVQLHSFACGYWVLPAPFVEESTLYSLYGFETIHHGWKAINHMYEFFWAQFYSIGPFVSLNASATLCWLLLLCSKFWKWEVWIPNVLLVQDYFAYLRLLEISYQFKHWCSSIFKKCHWNFDQDCTEYVDHFW